VTRAIVLGRCGGREADIPIDAFGPSAASEVFLTSSLRGVQPVARIDGARLNACPGPVTSAVAADFAEILANEPDP
jgi:branched-chain amino acid aminotransferase